jgi:hypothetical protein
VQKFSGILNVTGREIHPHGITDTGPTPENGRVGWSFNVRIYRFLKAMRLMKLRATPPSIKTWCSLMLAMVKETISGSYLAPAMLLGQSEVSKLIDGSIHLLCGSALGTGAVVATSRRRVLMMRRDVMSQEPLNMTWSTLWCSLSLDSESEWP